ncbi:PREDICTED: metallothionein-like protein 4B [Tarenaya hassleriana]|uniref:metallothionein-like protein 4B n=1 Tax=Tarenaya hassleriana TaxID=28532 RepID=UPI00053CA947|nr:PREDICTED: metallothionein-like protein 4B [Tarenaya hassleriana]
MADTGKESSGAACNDRCGCPSPCPGGDSCRCKSSEEGHMMCPCGAHCGCNPCNCTKTQVSGTGKAFCKCGDACSCATCAA